MINEVWQNEELKGCFARGFYCTYNPDQWVFLRLKYSTRIPLEKSIEDIRRNYRSVYRNEIKKNTLSIRFNRITKNNVDIYQKEYNSFAIKKGVTKFNRKRVLSYESWACGAYDENTLVIANIYLAVKQTAILLYSYSNTPPSKETGWAVKAIHDRAIEHFKSREFVYYDFGGISNKKKLQGINRLKQGFGGESIAYITGWITSKEVFKFYRTFKICINKSYILEIGIRDFIVPKIIASPDAELIIRVSCGGVVKVREVVNKLKIRKCIIEPVNCLSHEIEFIFDGYKYKFNYGTNELILISVE